MAGRSAKLANQVIGGMVPDFNANEDRSINQALGSVGPDTYVLLDPFPLVVHGYKCCADGQTIRKRIGVAVANTPR